MGVELEHSESLATLWPEGVLGQMLGSVWAVWGGERGIEVSTTARVVAASISSSQREGKDDELDVEAIESIVLWRLRLGWDLAFETRWRGAGRWWPWCAGGREWWCTWVKGG